MVAHGSIIKKKTSLRNLEDELSFLLPAIVDKNFKKAQIFCNSRHLSDLVGKVTQVYTEDKIPNDVFLASWLSKEMKKLDPSKLIAKLNGENSHMEKERVTRLFKEG